MDWNRTVTIASQVIVLIVLGVLAALDHDNLITDGLMVVSGSLVGTSLVEVVRKKVLDVKPGDPTD